MHRPPHDVVGGAQSMLHVPFEHVVGAAQALRHIPQCVALD